MCFVVEKMCLYNIKYPIRFDFSLHFSFYPPTLLVDTNSMAVELLNVQSLIYVGFRLAPFILVSFFTLSSLFNSDIKGIIFLSMLLFNCFVTLTVGNMFAADTFEDKDMNGICNAMSLTSTGPLSRNFPLNINIFGFTFAYLAYIIYKYNLIMTNIPTVIVFSVFILYQWYWNVDNKCSSALYSFLSLSFGFGLGWIMSMLVDKAGIVELQYFNGLKNKEVCKRANKQQFKCSAQAKV